MENIVLNDYDYGFSKVSENFFNIEKYRGSFVPNSYYDAKYLLLSRK